MTLKTQPEFCLGPSCLVTVVPCRPSDCIFSPLSSTPHPHPQDSCTSTPLRASRSPLGAPRLYPTAPSSSSGGNLCSLEPVLSSSRPPASFCFSLFLWPFMALYHPQPPPYLCLQRVNWVGPPQRQLRDLPPGAAPGSASPRNTSESSGPALRGETVKVREARPPGILALCQLGGVHVMKFHSGLLSSHGQCRSRPKKAVA